MKSVSPTLTNSHDVSPPFNFVTEARRTVIFFFIVMSLSAAEEVEKNLIGTVGGNITLPDPVLEFGLILRGVKAFAMVNKRQIDILEEIYKDKVLWNENTGVFTLTDLRRNDSGIYTIDSKKGRIFVTSYKLTVFDSVCTPAVNTVSVSSESCSLLCSVHKAEETTLLWYKDDEILNQSSSAVSLPLTVHKQDFNSSYRCVAANPAENKTVRVNVEASCSEQNHNVHKDSLNNKDPRHHLILIVMPIAFIIIVTLAACVIKRMYLDQNKMAARQTQEPVDAETEVQYTDIHICDNRCSQGGNLPESSGTADRSNLTTVYDKLEIHRMVLTDPADNV